MEAHRQHLTASGIQEERERLRLQSELMLRIQSTMLHNLLEDVSDEYIENLMQQMLNRQLDPASAVQRLLDGK